MLRQALSLTVVPALVWGVTIGTAPTAHAEVGVTDIQGYDSSGQQTSDRVITDPLLGGSITLTLPAGTSSTAITNDGDQPLQVTLDGSTTTVAIGLRIKLPTGCITPSCRAKLLLKYQRSL